MFQMGDVKTENHQTGSGSTREKEFENKQDGHSVFRGMKKTGADFVETQPGQDMNSLVVFGRYRSLIGEDGDMQTREAKQNT